MSGAINLWEISASADEILDPQNHYSATRPIPPEQIAIPGFGHLDANGRVYGLLPDGDPVITARVDGVANYFFSEGANVVTLQGLSCVGATSIDGTNFAAVKTTSANDYVTVEASLSSNDTNAANHIQWSGGEAVPGNPFQVRISKATSTKTTVTASLGSTSFSVNVWIIWSTISIQTSGSNNPSPLSFPPSPSYESGNQLGVHFGSNSNAAAGKVCVVAITTPAGVHTVLSNGWDFIQKKMPHLFVDGSCSSQYYTDTWMPDGPESDYKTKTLDSNDRLYTIDGPNIASVGMDSTDDPVNFYDYITWNSQFAVTLTIYGTGMEDGKLIKHHKSPLQIWAQEA